MSLFDADHWREIWNALRGNKVRTFLTAFGVFWGIFLLMVMMGSGTGLENGAMEGFSDGATNSVFVWGQRTTKPYRGLPIGRPIQLTNEDVEALRAQVSEAVLVAPRNQLGGFRGGFNVSRGTKSGAFSIMGDVAEQARIQAIPIVAGRFLNPIDLAERRKVCVIGARAQEVLFERGEDPVGEDIRIQGVYFRVIGIHRPVGSGGQAERTSQTIFIPFSTFQQAFKYGNRVDWLSVLSAEGVPASAAEEKIKEVLRVRHDVAPDDERAFGSWNMEEEFEKIQGVFIGIRLLVWIVGIGTLAAGVIGVSNIMLVIVRERTPEIGIRRAVGATPLAITGQVVLEALLLTAVAGYAGLIAGMLSMDLVAGLVPGGEGTFFKNPGVDLGSALRSLGILALAGLAAGLMPAWRAVRIDTVEALRSL